MKRLYDAEKKRLVYIGTKSNKKMWEERWKKEDYLKLFDINRMDYNDRLILDVTKTYLHLGAWILEGGCGLARNVMLLKEHGFNAVGVDYARQTLQKVKLYNPSLLLHEADLRKLPFSDGSIDAYWSIGVIEHFYHGYNEITLEMSRVLKPGGYLFLAVPSMSKLRIIKSKIGAYKKFVENAATVENFYQFAYRPSDIKKSFCRRGFTLVKEQGWNVYKGVSDEISCLKLVMSVLCRIIPITIENVFGKLANHMQLYIFIKTDEHNK